MIAERERERERERAVPVFLELGRYVFTQRPRRKADCLPGQTWLFCPGCDTFFVTKLEMLALCSFRGMDRPLPVDLVEYRRKGIDYDQMSWRRQMRAGLRRLHRRGLVLFNGLAYQLNRERILS